MVIIPERRAIFIHVPRTGGMSLSYALTDAFPHAVADLTTAQIHTTRQQLGGNWPSYKFFAIMRAPWDIVASYLRWCHMMEARDAYHSGEDIDLELGILAAVATPTRTVAVNVWPPPLV